MKILRRENNMATINPVHLAESQKAHADKKAHSKEMIAKEVMVLLLQQSSKTIKEALQKHLESGSDVKGHSSILDAILASLEANDVIEHLNGQTVQMMSKTLGLELGSLQDLEDQINQLMKKLNENLSNQQIAEIEKQLAELEKEYNAALSQEKAAESDAASDKKQNQSLNNELKKLEKELKNTTDPKKKAAIQKQMDEDKQKIQDNNSKIAQDSKTESSAQSTITSVENALEGLEGQYPSLKSAIETLIKALQSNQSGSSAFGALLNQLSNMSQENTQINQQINQLNGDLTALKANLEQVIETTKQSLEQVKESVQTDPTKNAYVSKLQKLLEDLQAEFHKVHTKDQTQQVKVEKANQVNLNLVEEREGLKVR